MYVKCQYGLNMTCQLYANYYPQRTVQNAVQRRDTGRVNLIFDNHGQEKPEPC